MFEAITTNIVELRFLSITVVVIMRE